MLIEDGSCIVEHLILRPANEPIKDQCYSKVKQYKDVCLYKHTFRLASLTIQMLNNIINNQQYYKNKIIKYAALWYSTTKMHLHIHLNS